MKVTALLVSDDVRDICDDNELPHPADIDTWLATHDARITETMEYAGKQEVFRLIEEKSDPEDIWLLEKGAEYLIQCAAVHREQSEPEHEVGDLQTLVRLAWAVMSDEQRTRLMQEASSRDLCWQ